MTDVAELTRRLLDICKAHGVLVTTAESCTGGMIVSLMTDLPGSSSMVDRGFVTNSNEAKMEMLGVARTTLDRYGAVSSETAIEMASGALERSRAGIALSVTGIAGPEGGSADKPVGLVWFGLAMKGRTTIAERKLFDNRGRDHVRRETARHAIEMALAALEEAALPQDAP
jgi:nicotinamide-nucleotide amidase